MKRPALFSLLLVVVSSCTSQPAISHEELMKQAAIGFVKPPWRDRLLASKQLWVGYAYGFGVRPLGEKVLLDAAQTAQVKKTFDKSFTTSPLKCMTHVDAAVFTEDGTAVGICFGCGVLVVKGEHWHGIERDATRALFTSVLGARPDEPDQFPGM